MPTFGKTDIGESTDWEWFMLKVGCPYQTSENGNLTSISVYISDEEMFSTEIKVALYSDRVGGIGEYEHMPNALLAESSAQEIIVGWNAVPITYPLVAGTWYHLTYMTDESTMFMYELNWFFYFFSAWNEWNGFTDPFYDPDWVFVYGGFMSIYGTYTTEEKHPLFMGINI